MHLRHENCSLNRVEQLGRSLGAILQPGDAILLEGPLGAGKTTLVRAIAAGLGIDPAMVSSPTFVVMNQYPVAASETELVHVDAFRLSGPDDLETIGWDRIADPAFAGILAVEWPERLGPGPLAPWSGRSARVTLHATSEDARNVMLELPDAWRERPGVDMLAPRPPTVCRITGRPVPADSPTWPFADERARMADLYRWMNGQYSVGSADDDDSR
jgi:tRNA threonylcarbamoyladenosine biosynthesis protein TsaE